MAKDIGIDLGTANVLIYVKGEGVVLNEPSVVALDIENKRILAVGKDANAMLGRTPGKVKTIRPIKDGVIADFEVTQAMLNEFINKISGKRSLIRPKILICCPSNITQVEKNAIKEAAESTGAKKVFLEEEPRVAAIGSGMDINSPHANMIVDIGGGTTDIAVLSIGGIVTSLSIKIAGNTLDKDIKKYIKHKYKLLIGDKTAENIKIKIGTVNKNSKEEKMEVKGRNLMSGLPNTIEISSKEVEEAIHESIEELVKAIKSVLEITPPELSADIVDKGLILTGGGCLIQGLPEILEKQLHIPVVIAASPLTSVIDGAGILLNNLELLST